MNFTSSFLQTQSLTRPPQWPAAVRQGPSTSPLKCLPSSKCLPRLATQSYTSVCEFCCCYPARTSATQRRLPGASLGCTQTNLAPIQTYESFSSQTLFALFASNEYIWCLSDEKGFALFTHCWERRSHLRGPGRYVREAPTFKLSWRRGRDAEEDHPRGWRGSKSTIYSFPHMSAAFLLTTVLRAYVIGQTGGKVPESASS